MTSNVEWLQKCVEHYRANKNDMCEAIEESEDLEKFGQGLTLVDPLEEVDIGDGIIPRPAFVSKNLDTDYKNKLIELFNECADCFAWNYQEMSGLSHDLVEHQLPLWLVSDHSSSMHGAIILLCMTASRRKLIGY
jgi:hypothetical protein